MTHADHAVLCCAPPPPHPQFDLGNLAMVTGGHNNGRVGTIVHKEKHRGGHDIVHIEDSSGNRCGLGAQGFVQMKLHRLGVCREWYYGSKACTRYSQHKGLVLIHMVRGGGPGVGLHLLCGEREGAQQLACVAFFR
jgi:hypothetical protein